MDSLKLGYADVRLLGYLISEKGVSAEEIHQSGLGIKTKRGLVDFFCGRLVISYWKAGRVMYMIGRKTHLTPDKPWEKGKYKKLATGPLIQNSYFYGEDAIRGARQIVIVEGVMDAVAAWQAGIPCVSPVTTQFRKKDHSRLLHLVRDIPEIFICNDSEENSEGDKGAVETAQVLQEAGKTARLPREEGQEKVDLNDYLKGHSREEFGRLMQQAHTLADVLLEKIDPEIQKHWLPNALESLFEYLASTDDAAGLLFINHRVKEYFGLSSRDIEALRKAYGETRKEVEKQQLVESVKEEEMEQDIEVRRKKRVKVDERLFIEI